MRFLWRRICWHNPSKALLGGGYRNSGLVPPLLHGASIRRRFNKLSAGPIEVRNWPEAGVGGHSPGASGVGVDSGHASLPLSCAYLILAWRCFLASPSSSLSRDMCSFDDRPPFFDFAFLKGPERLRGALVG